MEIFTHRDYERLAEILNEHYSAANQIRMVLVALEFAQPIFVDRLYLLDDEHFTLWQKLILVYRHNQQHANAQQLRSLAEQARDYLTELKRAKIDPFR